MFYSMVFIMIFFYCNLAITEGAGRVLLKSVDCKIHHSKIRTCDTFLNTSRQFPTFNLNLEFSEDMISPYANMKFNLLQNGERNMNIFNFKLDICKLFKQAPRRSLIQTFWKQVLVAAKNMPNKCPVKKNILYIMKDIDMSTDIIPSYMPMVNFSSTANLFEGNELMFTFTNVGIMCRDQKVCQSLLES